LDIKRPEEKKVQEFVVVARDVRVRFDNGFEGLSFDEFIIRQGQLSAGKC
jgi:hypothetical protein